MVADIDRIHDSHVIYTSVSEDLAIIHIPHGLVVPNFRSQQDGPQNHSLPIARMDIKLCIVGQPLQVHLRRYTYVYECTCG